MSHTTRTMRDSHLLDFRRESLPLLPKVAILLLLQEVNIQRTTSMLQRFLALTRMIERFSCTLLQALGVYRFSRRKTL